MRPVLEPGDRLLVVRRRRYRVGDLVAARDPRVPERIVVKRVKRVSGADMARRQYEVQGENAEASTDSRHFGPVAHAGIVGRVVYRYGPPGRVGRVRG